MMILFFCCLYLVLTVFSGENTLHKYSQFLKNFARYLGAKVFRTLLDMAGISYSKMSEVLTLIEKEEIVSLDRWIEFRNIRNELEHDYSDELEEALKDLRYCVDSFDYLHDVVVKVFEFARRYDESISLS